MRTTFWAMVHDGRTEPLEKIAAPDGTRVLVTMLPESEADFWLNASSASLAKVWDNEDDDRYAELLNNARRRNDLTGGVSHEQFWNEFQTGAGVHGVEQELSRLHAGRAGTY